MLERRLNELEVRFREISTEKVAPRLSSQLVRLLDQVGKRSEGHVEIALSRRELAQGCSVIQRALHTDPRLVQHVGVNHRRAHIFVAE